MHITHSARNHFEIVTGLIDPIFSKSDKICYKQHKIKFYTLLFSLFILLYGDVVGFVVCGVVVEKWLCVENLFDQSGL